MTNGRWIRRFDRWVERRQRRASTRRADDGPELATTSVDSVATDDRPTMATCVEELQQRSRHGSVGGRGRDQPPVSTERDSQSEFRQDGIRRPSAGQDNLNETLSLDDFDSRDRTVRIDSVDAAPARH